MRPVVSVRLLTLIAAGLAGASLLQAQAPFAGQAGSLAAASPAAHNVPHTRLLESYGRLPLHFESNQGQVDPQVKFLARGSGYSLFLTPTEAVLALRERGTPGPAVLRMKLAGANPSPHVTGGDELSGKTNYFVGHDPAQWRTNVPNYARVHYRGVYPGIDLVYYGNQGQLEYDFVVAPGADPGRITMSFDGARDIRIDPSGDLILQVAGGDLRQRKPVVYQEAQGVRQHVAGRYVIAEKRLVGFELGMYDETRPLVIDPVLVYSTYLGGEGNDQGNDIAVDGDGNAYVTGPTNSSTFPDDGAEPPTFRIGDGGGIDAFVAKLDSTGSALVYLTYLGGSGDDVGNGIAVDTDDNAYVTGLTLSDTFPIFPLGPGGAFDQTRDGQDAFVAKLNDMGSALVYSTFLGGDAPDLANDVAVDAAGHAYVTGQTFSSNFPTSLAFQLENRGDGDAFVTKLNVDGTDALYSTYLGGDAEESGNGIAVDALFNAYVTGQTFSSGDFPFPTSPVALQSTNGGAQDAFVTKLNPEGSALLYSTYLGGSAIDSGNDIAVDALGNAYVTGQTASDTPTPFPTTLGAFQTARRGTNDAFVTKLNTIGTGLVYSTYLGGGDEESGNGIAVDIAGSAYVTGRTSSIDFPTTPGEPLDFDTTLGGSDDAFVTQLNTAGSTTPIYSRYLGGSGIDWGSGIAVDAAGNAYVTGVTQSTDNFPIWPLPPPTTARAYQVSHNGGTDDAFVTKIGGFVLPPVAGPPATLTLTPREDTNPVGSRHCVTATVEDAAGNPVPGVIVHFEVEANGAVTDRGSRTTDASGQAEFCYTGPGTPRIDAVSAYADTNNDSTRDASEPGGVAGKTWVAVPPPPQTCGEVEGKGLIKVAGGYAGFWIEVEQGGGPGTPPQGKVIYLARKRYFRSTQITGLVITGKRATIHGMGRENNGPVVSFSVDVTDGRPDTFGILWPPGYAAGGPVLWGGVAVDQGCDDDDHDSDHDSDD